MESPPDLGTKHQFHGVQPVLPVHDVGATCFVSAVTTRNGPSRQMHLSGAFVGAGAGSRRFR